MEDRKALQRVRAFTKWSEQDRALSTLGGLMAGISLDEVLNTSERTELENWCRGHHDQLSGTPFGELVSTVRQSLQDGIITKEEASDIRWLIDQLRQGGHYYDLVTRDLQFLEGMIHGILADNRINTDEAQSLKSWMLSNEQLVGCYPYDEIIGLLVGVLKDGKIDDEEERTLKAFFGQFVTPESGSSIDFAELEKLKSQLHISGICALAPEIAFPNSLFCFTGLSKRAKRSEIAQLVTKAGGRFKDTVTQETDFLIYGAEGNPVWAYSCFGRKVEQAMNMRKAGHHIQIVSEIDFWDAMA